MWGPGETRSSASGRVELVLLGSLALVGASTVSRGWSELSAGLMAEAHALFLHVVEQTSRLDRGPLGALPTWASFGDEPLGLLEAPAVALAIALLFGLAVAGSRRDRTPRVVTRGLAAVEWSLGWLSLGCVPWILVTAVSVAPRRVAASLLLLWCFASGRGRPAGRWWRAAAASLAVLIPTWSVAIDRLGSLPASPLFSPGALWLAGPGRFAWLSGLFWVGLGVATWGFAHLRRGLAPPPPRRVLLAGLALALLGVTGAGQPGAGVADAIGCLALVPLAWAFGGLVGPLGRTWTELGATVLDSRSLLRSLMPALALAGLSTMQVFTAAMWTPPPVQAGVTRLSDTTNVFGIGIDQTNGDVWYTVRSTWTIGRIGRDADETRFEPGPPDPARWDTDTGVEQVYPGPEGGLWINLRRDGDESGFTVVGGGRGPGEYVSLPRCLTAAWRNLSDREARGLGGRPGDVLLGCEYQESVLLYRPAQDEVVRRLRVERGVDGVVPVAGGEHLAMVSCWGPPDVHLADAETGIRLADRIVGPVNFSIERGPRGDLWVPQHMHGALLGLDPEDLSVEEVVPLSFGLRTVRYDKARRRFWVTAPLTGLVWAVDADPPHTRTPFRVCGMARDLAIDQRDGTAVTGTHCGIFRLDVAAAREGM